MNGENLHEQLAAAHRRIDALKADNRLLGMALTGLEDDATRLAAELADSRRTEDKLRAALNDADKRAARLDADLQPVLPLALSLHAQALTTWEYADPRMKYVTVQIDKVDLPTFDLLGGGASDG